MTVSEEIKTNDIKIEQSSIQFRQIKKKTAKISALS